MNLASELVKFGWMKIKVGEIIDVTELNDKVEVHNKTEKMKHKYIDNYQYLYLKS